MREALRGIEPPRRHGEGLIAPRGVRARLCLPGRTGWLQLMFGKGRHQGCVTNIRVVTIAPELAQNRPTNVRRGGSHIFPGCLPDSLWERRGTPQIQRAAVIVRCMRLDIHIHFAFAFGLWPSAFNSNFALGLRCATSASARARDQPGQRDYLEPPLLTAPARIFQGGQITLRNIYAYLIQSSSASLFVPHRLAPTSKGRSITLIT